MKLHLPRFSTAQDLPTRSGLHWLAREGDRVEPLQPIAYCTIEFDPRKGGPARGAFVDDGRDLQIVLAPRTAGLLRLRDGFARRGGWLDLHGKLAWDAGIPIAEFEGGAGEEELLFYFVAGRRGFEHGEGRGGLLTGWHDRIRAFWPGAGSAPLRTVISLGTCEQLPLIRGEGHAFADWFAGLRTPLQLVLHSDDRLVHSAPVLLQQLDRTPAQTRALLEAVQLELGALAGDAAHFPEVSPDAPGGRHALAHDFLVAQHLAAESANRSPLLEQLGCFGPAGLTRAAPPELVCLSLGSEYARHFRHRRTGWLIALHGFRVSELGPAGRAWLRSSFEPVTRTHEEIEAGLAALAGELRARSGARLLINNLISTTTWDRVPNYAWLGDGFAQSSAVVTGEANLLLDRLAARGLCTVADFDAATALVGGRNCPDRVHAGGALSAAFRDELLRLVRAHLAGEAERA